jgi:hypothetical protein
VTTGRTPVLARRIAVALVGAGLVLLLAPLQASAQMRQLTGKIDQVAGDRMLVRNRMGDQFSFVRGKETVVKGRKSKWSKLAAQDRVVVAWKFVDKPRKAYVVKVLAPREDE